MKLRNAISKGAFVLAAGIVLAGQMALADVYLREGNQEIEVVDRGGQLFCTRTSDGYEMCNGMTKAADGSYQGRTMKHPDMPKFMTFNGTVVIGSNALQIKGCAMGICDSEVWQMK